jgi:hypothetical protein
LSGLPTPPVGLTPCPEDKPCYNGTCVKCLLPRYWSVKDSACLKCPKGTVFGINTKTCTVPIGKSLTLLQGTKWVTAPGNIT